MADFVEVDLGEELFCLHELDLMLDRELALDFSLFHEAQGDQRRANAYSLDPGSLCGERNVFFRGFASFDQKLTDSFSLLGVRRL